MQYFVLVGLHMCLRVKHLRAFAVILALAVAVSGMAIAQDAVKDGKEKRGGFIKENPKIRAQAVKFGTSKKGIKTPSEEIQPVKILGEKEGGTTDEVVVTSPPYVPPPPPPITIGGTAGSGYFGYGNTSDPGSYGGGGASGTGETPADVWTNVQCTCDEVRLDFAPRPIPAGGPMGPVPSAPDGCNQSCTTFGILSRYYVAKLSVPAGQTPTDVQICTNGEYVSFNYQLEIFAKNVCDNNKEVGLAICGANGNGPAIGTLSSTQAFLADISVSATPCRGR